VEAFVPPLSRQQVPGQDLARRTHAAHLQPPPPARRPGDDHGLFRPAASAADPWELPSAYIRNQKLAIYY
jgi:hypothetical protein